MTDGRKFPAWSTIWLEVWRSSRGGIQVSITELDERGAGGGVRLLGGKFDGGSELLAKKELTPRDARELHAYADKILERARA